MMQILTDTARRYISRNHDGALACLELVEDPVAFVLLLIAMNCWDRELA